MQLKDGLIVEKLASVASAKKALSLGKSLVVFGESSGRLYLRHDVKTLEELDKAIKETHDKQVSSLYYRTKTRYYVVIG